MIHIHNVVKKYLTGENEFYALRDINLEINEGEFVAIMGPSGSGKSTLMNIIGALDTPTTGSYKLDNQLVSKLNDNELAQIRSEKIGFVFQSFNLLPRASALRNVLMPLMYNFRFGNNREGRARECLEMAGLSPDRFNHMTNQLSGGQMQRVAIARALVNDPKVILADEPTGNLDSKTGELVLHTFQSLHEQGRTIVLITHEEYVAEYAERIITIRDGSIVRDSHSHTRRKSTQSTSIIL